MSREIMLPSGDVFSDPGDGRELMLPDGSVFAEEAGAAPPVSPFPLPWRTSQRYDEPLTDQFSFVYQQRRIQPVPIQVLQSHTPPPLHRNEQQGETHYPQPVFDHSWYQLATSQRRWPIPLTTPIVVSQRVPWVPRDPKLELPLRKFVDLVSQIMNSMLRSGQLLKAGETKWQTYRSGGIVATRAPGSTDDETQGYVLGQMWVDTSLSMAYVSVDVTENAAVWVIVSNLTAAQILTLLLTVDGVGSGLDADLLDGLSATAFALAAHTHAVADITNIAHGTWTPTATAVSNCDSITPLVCLYNRIGDIVNVCGAVTVDQTSSGTLTALRLSLPIASNFADIRDAAGVVSPVSATQYSGAFDADAANDELLLTWQALDTTSATYRFSGSYRIL